MATSSSFPHCCGAVVVSGFGYDGGVAFPYPHRAPTESEKVSIRNDIVRKIDNHSGMGIIVVMLNSLQVQRGLEDVVKECGFKKAFGPCFHPVHGRDITLYAYEPNPKRRGEKGELKPRDNKGRFAGSYVRTFSI